MRVRRLNQTSNRDYIERGVSNDEKENDYNQPLQMMSDRMMNNQMYY